MGIRIFEAGLEELDRLIEIEERCFTSPWPKFAFAAEMMFNDSFFFALENDGIIEGFGGLRIIAGEGHIMNIAVMPEHRSKGFGKMLLEKLLESGKAQGVSEFTLEVRVGNKNAIALYEKAGFVSEGRRRRYYDDGEDAYIMWKRD